MGTSKRNKKTGKLEIGFHANFQAHMMCEMCTHTICGWKYALDSIWDPIFN